MTDVLDDSVSWEQRRELRKKKRQELLAEADRLVKKTDESSASSRFSQDQNDEDDEFERERQRRRREREERRRKDREELESQLKDEAEMKAERERRREERRRQREMEKESYQPAVESYSSKTVVSKTVETPEDHNLEEETTVETEHEETVEEHVAENGHAEAEEDVQNDISEPEPEPEPEPEAEIEEKDTYETSITAASVTSSTRERFSDEDHEADEVQQKLNDMKLKSEQSDEKHQEDAGDDYDPEDSKARLKELEERKRLREKKRLEEEEKEREEAAKREAQHQDQLRIEREEREKRRAEAEVKRQEYRKQLSQAEDKEAAPLSPKNLTSPLSSKKADTSLGKFAMQPSKERKLVEGKYEKKTFEREGPAVPRRTQSARMLSGPVKYGKTESKTGASSLQKTQSINRKKSTRKSLDAMEKQAGELYDFLSDLENKKATSNSEDFLSFLTDDTPTRENDSSRKGFGRRERGKRTSVKDRAKLFLKPDIKEEIAESDNVPAPIRKPTPVAKDRRLVNSSNNQNKSDASLESKQDDVLHNLTRDNSACKDEKLPCKDLLEKDNYNTPSPNTTKSNKQDIETPIRPQIPKKPSHLLSKHADVPKTIADTTAAHSVGLEVDSFEKEKLSSTMGENKLEVSVEKTSSCDAELTHHKHLSACSSNAESLSSTSTLSSSVNERSLEKTDLLSDASVIFDGDTSSQHSIHSTKGFSELSSNLNAKAVDSLAHEDSKSLVLPEVQTQEQCKKSCRVEQLNKHITESSKSKTHDAPKVGSLDSRLEKYTKQASKQEVKKAVDTPGKVAQDVSNRRNKWERGEVQSAEKSLTKKETITTAGGISSRKNLWESGKLGSSAGKSTREATEVKGADFSSRRNQWLKVSQKENVTKKSESPVGMKTGVMSRLNRWEKGEVGTAATPDKSKAKGNLPVSGVVDRRAKWENINSETSKTPVQKSSVRVTANISNRRNKFETKEAEQPAEATNRVNKEEYEDRSIDEAEDAQGYDDEEISTHSSDNLGDYEKDSD